MKKVYTVLLGMILPLSSVCAQSFDFYQDGLKDLYLDYLNTLSKDKVVEVYRDVTYWNLFGMREGVERRIEKRVVASARRQLPLDAY